MDRSVDSAAINDDGRRRPEGFFFRRGRRRRRRRWRPPPPPPWATSPLLPFPAPPLLLLLLLDLLPTYSWHGVNEPFPASLRRSVLKDRRLPPILDGESIHEEGSGHFYFQMRLAAVTIWRDHSLEQDVVDHLTTAAGILDNDVADDRASEGAMIDRRAPPRRR